MLNLIPSTGVELNTVVTSENTISGVEQTLTITGGTLVINGQARAAPCDVLEGDEVAVSVTSSSTPLGTTFAVISSSASYDVSTYFVTTKASTSPQEYPQYKGVLPFDLTQNPDGTPLTLSTGTNAYQVYNITGEQIVAVDLAATLAYPEAEATSYSVVADYLSNTIYLFTDQHTLVARKSYPSKVYGGTSTGNPDDVANNSVFWVSLPDQNRIVGLNHVLDELFTVSIGQRPMGLATIETPYSGDTVLAVCSSDNNQVILIEIFRETVLRSVTVPGKPLEVVIAGDVALVTLSDVPKLCSINLDTYAVTLIDLPNIGHIIAYDGDLTAYVCCTTHLARLSLPTSVQATPIPGAYLSGVAIVGSEIYVSDINQSRIIALDSQTLEVVSEFSVTPRPYSMQYAHSKLVVGSFYPNTPNLLFIPDLSPSQFSLSSTLSVPRNYELTTNAVTVDGLYPGTTITASIPSVFGSTLIKNGQPLGLTTTTVENGDTVAFKFTTPSAGLVAIEIPIVIGDQYDYFSSVTLVIDVTPDPFKLTSVIDQQPGATVLSENVTITGIDSDVVVNITATPTSVVLYKNGVSLGANYGSFSLGDVLRVGVAASTEYCDTVGVVLTVGEYVTVWTISTKPPLGHFLLADYSDLPLWELPKVGEVDVNLEAVAVTATSLSGAISRVPLAGTPTGSTNTVSYVTVLDTALNKVVQIDTTTNQVSSAFVPPVGSLAVALDYYPRETTRLSVLTHLAVVTTSKLHLLDGNLALIREVDLPHTPSACCTMISGHFIVASEIASTLLKYFILDDVVTLVSTIPYISSPDLVVEDVLNTGKLLVGSRSNKSLRVLNSSMTQVKIKTGLVVRSVAVDTVNRRIYLADSLANKVHVWNDLYEEQAPFVLDGPPSDVTVDSSGFLYVTNLYTGAVSKYDPLSYTLLSTKLFNKAVLGAATLGSSLFVLESTATIDLESSIKAVTQLALPTFTLIDNVTQGAEVQSMDFVVEGLNRPVNLYVDPYPGAFITQNGIDTGLNKVLVSNGDVISITQVAPNGYFTEQALRVGACSSSTIFPIRTGADLVPDVVNFNTLYNQYVGDLAVSNEVTVSGITPGHTTTITFDFGATTGAYYLNGELTFSDTAVVTNGDVIQLVVMVEGPYGTVKLYPMKNLGSSLGAFRIWTLNLDGALPWPDFGRNRTSSSPLLLERDHYFTPDMGVHHGAGSTQAKVDVLPVGAFSPGTTQIEYLCRSLSDNYVIVRPMTDSSPMPDNTSVGGPTRAFSDLPSSYKDWVTVTLFIPDPLTATPRGYATSAFTGVRNFTGITYDLLTTPSILTSVQLSVELKSSEYWPHVKMARAMQEAPINYLWSAFDRPPLAYLAQMLYNPIRYDVSLVIDASYEESSWASLHEVNQAFELPVSSLYGTRVVQTSMTVLERALVNALPVYWVRTTTGEFRPVVRAEATKQEQFFTFVTSPEWEDYTHALHRFGYLSLPFTFKGIPNFYVLNDFADFHYTMAVVVLPEWRLQQPFAHDSGMAQGILDQDVVTYCPPFGTCTLRGLYPSLLEAFAAAQEETDSMRELTAVPYRGCYLWTEDPTREIKVCASVGPNDTWIIPYAWAIAQGPMLIAKTQRKVSHYLQGG